MLILARNSAWAVGRACIDPGHSAWRQASGRGAGAVFRLADSGAVRVGRDPLGVRRCVVGLVTRWKPRDWAGAIFGWLSVAAFLACAVLIFVWLL
jgi:hypothetical protein